MVYEHMCAYETTYIAETKNIVIISYDEPIK